MKRPLQAHRGLAPPVPCFRGASLDSVVWCRSSSSARSDGLFEPTSLLLLLTQPAPGKTLGLLSFCVNKSVALLTSVLTWAEDKLRGGRADLPMAKRFWLGAR